MILPYLACIRCGCLDLHWHCWNLCEILIQLIMRGRCTISLHGALDTSVLLKIPLLAVVIDQLTLLVEVLSGYSDGHWEAASWYWIDNDAGHGELCIDGTMVCGWYRYHLRCSAICLLPQGRTGTGTCSCMLARE